MGFAVPRRLRFERWALTPPFHPYRRFTAGGIFSVALSVGTPRGITARVYPEVRLCVSGLRGIAPFGVRTFLLLRIAPKQAILRPSKTGETLAENDLPDKHPSHSVAVQVETEFTELTKFRRGKF
jgi:hypothetical protein